MNIEQIKNQSEDTAFMRHFSRWWVEDYSWAGLARKKTGNSNQTLQDCWRSEEDHLLEFGGREWTALHMPPFDQNGNWNDNFQLDVSLDRALKGRFQSKKVVGKSEPHGIFSGLILQDFMKGTIDLTSGNYRDCILMCEVNLKGDILSTFSSCLFLKPVTIAGARFSHGNGFANSYFLEQSSFNRSEFFGNSPNFSHCTFKGDSDFGFAKFNDKLTRFHSARFEANVDFSDVRANSAITFERARMRRDFLFQRAIVNTQLNLSSAKFFGQAMFRNAKVLLHPDDGVSLDCSNTVFGKEANFQHLVVDGLSVFNGSRFRGMAKFDGGSFDGGASFLGCKFRSIASFVGKQFKLFTIFAGSSFYSSADFSGFPTSNPDEMDAFDQLTMAGDDNSNLRTEFFDDVRFDNRIFSASTTFSGAQFHGSLSFHNSRIHPYTSFAHTVFAFELRRRPNLHQFALTQPDLERIEDGFRSAKTATASINSRHDQFMFHALEMEARRRRESVDISERLSAGIYKLVSNYGQSIARPIQTFLGATFLWFLIYECFGLLQYHGEQLGRPVWLETLRFTLQQFARPFSIWSGASSENEPLWVQMIWDSGWFGLLGLFASLQSALGIVIFTLFVFSIRRRFQIG